MTETEKKRALALVRALEFLYSENAALKVALLSHHIPKTTWEPMCSRLMNDPQVAPEVRAKFRHLYDEIEQASDQTAALEALLRACPTPSKDWN